MKITSVEPQKKSASRRTNRFNIFLDGQFAFGADKDLVVDRRLIVGKEIGKEDLQVLLEEAELGKLMERLYGLLGRRQRSEKEIRDYFRIKNYGSRLSRGSPKAARVKEKQETSELVIDKLIEKLKRKGLINDLEFAKAWVESRSKKKGTIALKSELFQKGIDREIIEEVVSRQSSVVSEKKTAISLLGKRIIRWKNLPKPEIKQKALRFLQSRGFDYDTSKEVIENLMAEGYN